MNDFEIESSKSFYNSERHFSFKDISITKRFSADLKNMGGVPYLFSAP